MKFYSLVILTLQYETNPHLGARQVVVKKCVYNAIVHISTLVGRNGKFDTKI